MTVSKLIKELTRFLEINGDMEVYFAKSKRKGEPYESIGRIEETFMLDERYEDVSEVCTLLPKKGDKA